MRAVVTIGMLLMILLLACVTVAIGIYVWRDAKKRGMNSEMWTLIAVLAPLLIGFIIYLMARGSYCDLRCPSCTAPVNEEYVICPNCGARLKASCPACLKPVESDWRVCPYCEKKLEPDRSITPPLRKKDRTLTAVLAVVIIIPLIIIGSALLLSFSEYGNGSVNTIFYESEAHYLECMAEKEYAEELKQWLNELDTDMVGAYALRYRTQVNGEKVTQYLVFLPFGDENTSIDTKGEFGIKNNVSVNFVDNGSAEDGGYRLCTVSVRGNVYVALKTYLNGEKLPCKIEDFEHQLTPFELVERKSEG